MRAPQTHSTITEAFAAWQEAMNAAAVAAQAGDEASASGALDRAADLEGLAVNLPVTTAGDVLALIRMTMEPGDANSPAAEALIARVHTEAA